MGVYPLIVPVEKGRLGKAFELQVLRARVERRIAGGAGFSTHGENKGGKGMARAGRE